MVTQPLPYRRLFGLFLLALQFCNEASVVLLGKKGEARREESDIHLKTHEERNWSACFVAVRDL